MKIIEPKKIKDVCVPKELDRQIKKMEPEILKSIKKNDPNSVVESGIIILGDFNKKQKINLFLLSWISHINEVIYNLNLTISDLKKLPTNYLFITGSPYKRYQLLVRIFFYEFYRFKDIFHQSMKLFRKLGFFKNDIEKSITDNFLKLFKNCIDTRNSLVHNEVIWKGEKHFKLFMVGLNYDFGYEVKDIKSGEVTKYSEVLCGVCDHMA